MKKMISLLMVALLLLLCGCGPNANEFRASYLYTGYNSQTQYPVISVLHSVDERDACAAQAGSAQVTEALSTYGDKFFQSHVLFVLNIEMGSSAFRYEVEKVYADGDITTFVLKKTVPGGMFTGDMSGMHILVEMDESWDCKPENVRIEKQ